MDRRSPMAVMPLSRRRFVQGFGASLAMTAPLVRAQSDDPTRLTIRAAAARIRAGELSPVTLTRAYLDRIGQFDGRINSYITVTADLALAQAASAEAEIAAGRWRGPLHGIPLALKDNIDTAGIRTTAASAVFADRVPTTDATVVRRLRDAGAVLLGKLNMHEFAYGGSSAITHFGPVHNPWNLDYIPGGSSGGSAAAVSARLCAAALGTDTLASIRLPAAYCGVVGLKATHGLASIAGIVPVAESLDHVGPLARSVDDAALVMAAITGYDSTDPVSIQAVPPDFASAIVRRTDALRVGLPQRPYFRALDPDIERATREAVSVIERLVGKVQNVTLPEAPSFEVLLAEAFAYHERFLADPVNDSRYDPATRARIVAAGEFPASAYIRASRDLIAIRREIARVFDEVDLIVTPTTPVMPTTIENAELPATNTGAESTVRNTAPFNLYGIPTITVPCGLSPTGLPIGLQISGAAMGEVDVLALAHAFEQATAWHLAEPQLA